VPGVGTEGPGPPAVSSANDRILPIIALSGRTAEAQDPKIGCRFTLAPHLQLINHRGRFFRKRGI
jgi:hypothetical protein